MLSHSPPYAILSIISVLVTLIASIAAWRQPAPGSRTLSLLLLSMAIWSGCYTTRWLDLSVEAKVFWFRIMFLGVATIPTLFLVFALGFTRNESWLTSRNLMLLSLQPVISLLLQWTNSYHHLLYSSLHVVQSEGSVVMELTRGPWYFFNIVYSYAVIGIGIFLMSQAALRSGPLYRYQYRLVLVACLLPWGGNILNESYFSSFTNLDIAPLTFGLSGVMQAPGATRSTWVPARTA